MKIKRLSCDGFTLLEVLVVIAIIAIASAISAPVVKDFVARYRLRGAARDVSSVLQLTRLEAVKRKINCAMTFSQPVDGKTYDYVAFVDSDEDWAFDSNETILASRNYGTTISDNGITFVNNGESRPAVAFNSRGLPRENGGSILTGTREVKLKNDQGNRKVSISTSGRIRIE